jgi:phage terminase large subunit GpA-like protein
LLELQLLITLPAFRVQAACIDTLHALDSSPGPRYMHLPEDLPGDIRRQLCSEEQFQIDGVAVWKVKDGHTDNHCWDCNIYADLAGELAGVFTLHDVNLVQGILKGRETLRRQAERRNNRDDDFQEGIPELV